jgi:ABC-type uncharacterized transport system auxiliary subunit
MIAMLTIWLGACSMLPKPAAPPTRHDLGPPAAAQRARSQLPGRVRLTDVSAASWLSDAAIYYRRLDADSSRLRRYARNEWLAPPAELIAARLGNAFDQANAKAPNAVRYRLDLHLVALEQNFSNSHQAHEVLRVEAALGGGALSAHKLFTIKRKTSPTIAGAVKGTVAAVNRLAAKLIGWVRTQTARQQSSEGHP